MDKQLKDHLKKIEEELSMVRAENHKLKEQLRVIDNRTRDIYKGLDLLMQKNNVGF